MASRMCWHCKTNSHMTRISTARSTGLGAEALWALPCVCDNCGAASVATIKAGRLNLVSNSPTSLDEQAARQIEQRTDLVWLPQLALGKEFADVPSTIADAASEAYACYSIRSYRAAILLARAVVEAVAKEQGATNGDLSKKINQLAANSVITPFLKDTAHEIRYIGNEMAHGDFVVDVSEEECDDVLNFMSVLLESVYQQPAKLSRYQEARQRRKEQGRANAEDNGSGSSTLTI